MLSTIDLGAEEVYLFILILVIGLTLIFPVLEILRKIKKEPPSLITEQVKVRSYTHTIAWGWGKALVVLVLCLFAGISFYDVGLRGISLHQNIWFTSITLILCGLFFVVNICCMIAYLLSSKYRKGEHEQLAKNKAETWKEILSPRSKKEKTYFFFVSLTAGVSEEFVFRGVLFFLLQAVFPTMSMPLILVVASAIFGIAHTYQGMRGIVRTGITGAMFGALFLVTGSLIPGMVLHFIIDFEAAFQLSESGE